MPYILLQTAVYMAAIIIYLKKQVYHIVYTPVFILYKFIKQTW